MRRAEKGLRLGSGWLTMSLYVDDIILYVQRPGVNLPPLLEQIVRYGKFSGLRINWDKSDIFPLTDTPPPAHPFVSTSLEPG